MYVFSKSCGVENSTVVIQLMLEAFKSRGPGGLEDAYSAASSIATGVSCTFVDLGLAAGPCEARPAGTGVTALASVATSGSIHAGLVVSAVVEV